MSTIQLTFDDIGISLQHLDVARFLDDKSVIALSTTSKLCLQVVKDHVSLNIVVPIWCSLDPIPTISFIIYKPSRFFWRPQITIRKLNFKGANRTAVFISPNYYNVSSFPQQTKRGKCLFEVAHMIEGLPNLTHLIIRALELCKDESYLQKLNIRQSTIDYLSLKITHLKLMANLSVDNLPISVTHLSFGYYFNKPVDHLPQRLTHLSFRGAFSQNVDYLPQTLTHLKFGHLFNRDIDHLPSNLKFLSLGSNFNQLVDNLPESLTVLKFSITDWPKFNHYMDHLPHSLTTLVLFAAYKLGLEYLPLNTTVVKQ